jgi:hypothetical protein
VQQGQAHYVCRKKASLKFYTHAAGEQHTKEQQHGRDKKEG